MGLPPIIGAKDFLFGIHSKADTMRFLILIIAFFWTIPFVSSQEIRHVHYQCVENQAMLTERVTENKAALKNGLAFPREDIFVPVKLHLAADSEGLGRVDLEDVLAQMCDLNSEFTSTGFQFYIDNGFNLIDNDLVYESPALGAGVAEMIRQQRDNGEESLNIFVTLRARDGNEENGTVLGYYAIENDWIVIRSNQIGNGVNTLAHEIGHYFSLKHPHSGWESDPWEESRHGNPVLITRINGVRIELVDGSNCETSGDQLCDTPPDYNFGLRWDSRCPPFNLNIMDRNMDTILPQQNNYMSYFLGCEPYIFSRDQQNLMMAEYMSSRKESIRTGYIPVTAEIPNTLELISPANNTTTDFFNGIELQWPAVENASQYLLKMRSGSSEIIRITSGTSIYVTELLPDKTYTWSITPFNEGYTCAGKQTNILRTNDETTNTIDPAFAETVSLYPNPTSGGNTARLSIDANEQLQGQLNLYNVSGERISTEQVFIQQGKNNLNLKTNQLQSGVYMLSLTTSKGNLNRKLIITK